jgi:GT2 family glycosyltransferase
MSYPKVYIILLTYNNWADTIECLESVLRNDYPSSQVIIETRLFALLKNLLATETRRRLFENFFSLLFCRLQTMDV